MSDDNWFENHDRLTEDQKKILYNELKKFTEYGDAVYQEQDLNKIAAKFEAVSKYAKRYLNEKASDSFDQVTINRNMKELDKKVRKFKKEAKKVQKHQDRLTALYDDIGIIFDRYFGVGEDNSDAITESKKPKDMKLSEKKLRGLVREELKRVLTEQRVEFDREKMLNLMDRDRFIRHVVRDEARDPENPSDRVLRRIFNSHVLGEYEMEKEYEKADDTRRR